MDSTSDDVTRAHLCGLTPSGDLLDLALQMRQMGVESLLISRPDGRIRRTLTDRQIAHLAATPSSGELIPEQLRRRPLPWQSTDQLPAGPETRSAGLSSVGETVTDGDPVAASTDR